jgi:hypothetical protein
MLRHHKGTVGRPWCGAERFEAWREGKGTMYRAPTGWLEGEPSRELDDARGGGARRAVECTPWGA